MKNETQCVGCGKPAETKSSVESTIHTHHTAHKVQKRVFAIVTFQSVNDNSLVTLCGECQHKVLGPMVNGGNIR